MPGRCHNCQQNTLTTELVPIGSQLVAVSMCSDCDTTICGHCLAHQPRPARYCSECRHHLGLPRYSDRPIEPDQMA